MVKEKAAGKPLLFVEVSCWGFQNSSRASEHLVERCVEALAERVDCTELRNLPQHYVSALSATGPWGASLASLFGRTSSPHEQLNRFEPILSAIDVQLVAVIEDADRNGNDFDPTHIEAMLHDFRSVPRLSFILTVDDSRGFEFPKIAEAIEFLPSVALLTSLCLLDEVRTELRNQKNFIDPPDLTTSSRHHRPDRIRDDPEEEQSGGLRFSRYYATWPPAAAELLSTPRRLKNVLNALRRDWPHLRGEVDIDVWIMTTVLRHCAPATFTFLGSYLPEMKRMSGSGWGNSEDGRKAHAHQIAQLRDAWLQVRELNRDPAEIILMELVPGLIDVFGERRVYAPNRIQGIHQKKGPDYWDRIVAGAVSPNDVTDQSVLTLLALAETDDEVLLKLANQAVNSNVFSERLAFFQEYTQQLRHDVYCALMSRAHKVVCDRDGPRACTESRGFGALHSELIEIGRSAQNVRDWLETELPSVARNSLRLANDIFHAYTRNQDWRVECRRKFVEAMHDEMLHPIAGGIAQRLDASFPWSLYHLVYCFGEENQESILTRAQDWSNLGASLFAETQHCPETMVPQVTRLVGQPMPAHPNVPTDFLFSRNKLEGLFGESWLLPSFPI